MVIQKYKQDGDWIERLGVPCIGEQSQERTEWERIKVVMGKGSMGHSEDRLLQRKVNWTPDTNLHFRPPAPTKNLDSELQEKLASS